MSKAIAITNANALPVNLTPATMLERAVTGGADIAVVEKLMGLQERWEKGQAVKAYNGAISQARAKLPIILKTRQKTGAGGAYSYEGLDDIARIVDPILTPLGLSYRWRSEPQPDGKVLVACVITHVDGHSEETSLAEKPDTSGSKNPVQALGSTVTYLQRYTLKLALGLATTKDDDGTGGRRGAADSSLDQETLPKAKSRPVYEGLIDEMRAITDKPKLTSWGLENTQRIYSMHVDFQKFFRNEYADHLTAINEGVTEDGSPLKKALRASLHAADAEVVEPTKRVRRKDAPAYDQRHDLTTGEIIDDEIPDDAERNLSA